jgi:general secretion pathway protein I
MSARIRGQAGFTLLEVMIALAILASALTVLVRSVGRNVGVAQEAEALTVVTNLARAKMADLEESLIKDGFLETDQSSEGDFGDDGWADITWKAKVEPVEMPSFDQLQQLQNAQVAKGSGAGSGSGSGSGDGEEGGGFADSALGGMFNLMGGMGGATDAASAAGGNFIQQQFELVQEVLKASIRKVTLTIHWKVMGKDQELPVVAYFTDPAGMNKVIGSLGMDTGNPQPDPGDGGNPPPPPGK